MVAVVAAKYGLARTISALTGDGGLGDFAAELFGELAKSEERLVERLDRMERRLRREMIEQQYATGINFGQRILRDAFKRSDPEARSEDLMRASREFERASSTHGISHLQRAVAERYTLLAHLAQAKKRDFRGMAREALQSMDHAATEAILESARLVSGFDNADGNSSRLPSFRRRRHEDDGQDQKSIEEAANETVILGTNLLREAQTLSSTLGFPASPDLISVAPMPRASGRSAIGRLMVTIVVPGTGRIGALSIQLQSITLRNLGMGLGRLEIDGKLRSSHLLSHPVDARLTEDQIGAPGVLAGIIGDPTVAKRQFAGEDARLSCRFSFPHVFWTGWRPSSYIFTVGDILDFRAEPQE